MSKEFYNRVAATNKRYGSDATVERVYPAGDPEAVFKEKLLEVSGTTKTALDIGCADGRFTLSLASNFKSIVGIDISDGMLKVAEGFRKDDKVMNVQFKLANASQIPFPDKSFDVVINRRGPRELEEAFRVLKPGGAYVEIRIGAKDTKGLKEVFKRGQGYGKWDRDIQNEEESAQRAVGFNVTFSEAYEYAEFFASRRDLEMFLSSVPIFEDFDTEKDKTFLDEYESSHSSEQGIRLDRERYVFVSRKPQ